MPDERLVAAADLMEITIKLATLVKHNEVNVSFSQSLQCLCRFKPANVLITDVLGTTIEMDLCGRKVHRPYEIIYTVMLELEGKDLP